MWEVFRSLPKNIGRCFLGYNILWHLLAIGLTYVIVATDLDWSYFLHTRSSVVDTWLFPAVFLGGLLPIFVPLLLLAIGEVRKNFRIKNTAFALAQAAIAGLLISSFYKAFTGRIPPPRILMDGQLADISHGFRLGFLRGGVFWGWPSSHTTIAFAMAMTLFFLYPKNKIIRVLVLVYATYVGLGVSVSIHWFSEAIAGVIFGSVIGTVVGKYFYKKII